MPSTQKLENLLPISELKKVCKAIAVLDAILCQEWEYRFYSYNSKWGEGEECASMRTGGGDEYHILFNDYGAAINGFAHESEMSNWIEAKEVEIKVVPKNFKEKVISFFIGDEPIKRKEQGYWAGIFDNLPMEFHEFIFGEPVKSIGTTFCIWRGYKDKNWHLGNIKFPDDDYKDGSSDLLELLGGDPKKYKNYGERLNEDCKLTIKTIKKIYNGDVLTKAIVESINPDFDDWEQLVEDLDEIDYPHEIEV